MLGISAAAVSYHRRRLGLRGSAKYAPRKDWEEIQRFYDEGHSLRECEIKFSFSRRSWSKAVLRGAIVPRPHGVPLDELLVVGRRRQRGHIKRRLISSGLKQERCDECGIREWLDQPLAMALHHINGDGQDNRLENLLSLCPNCHSQTRNFARRASAA
ncbi:MAG TPA: HNH endonuclease signature motif containing protein [Thermoleophilaceae bacterium]|nr:HNH endonuclease signature motif containing protein [Thermoleophilaceae bacterium]